MKTSKIKLELLHNEEHSQFSTDFAEIVNQHGAKRLNIETEFNKFDALFAQEKEALQVVRKSAATESLVAINCERSDIYRGIVDAVKSGLKHFNPTKQASAVRLKVLLNQYGNIARKSYDEESASINKIILEFRGNYSADIATLGIDDWVAELEIRNNTFAGLMKNRNTEDASKTDLRMKEVRVDVDSAYRAIIKKIDALMLINGDTNYQSFVRELNARITRSNDILAQRKGRNSKNS